MPDAPTLPVVRAPRELSNAECVHVYPEKNAMLIRRHIAVMFTLVCCSMASVPQAFAQAPGAGAAFKSTRALAARAEFEKAKNGAREDYVKRLNAARDRYSDALDTALKLATKSGDLEEANLLKGELDDLQATDFVHDLPDLIGSWRMRWGESAYTNYHFLKDGTVTRELEGAPKVGRLRRVGTDLVVEFSDNSVMRVNLAGPRLLLEYWPRTDDYSRQLFPRQVGIGARLVK